ncbi:MAG: hypothetical protein HOW73_03840 [Polyangiaceae bacterium]|nr:hypothetical protein [Polyangiaceae bacterium]
MLRLAALRPLGGIALLATGCAAEVIVVDDDAAGGNGGNTPVTTSGGGNDGGGGGREVTSSGGDGGAGGHDVTSSGGGGSEPETRFVEVDLETRGLTPTNAWVVLVNAATGELKQTLTFNDLPAQVEVVDGDLVSFYERREEERSLASYVVGPDVTRIAEVGATPELAGCASRSMQVRVVFPAIEGATDYFATTDKFGHSYAQSGPGEHVMEIESCGDTFDFFAYARNGSRIIGHELLRNLPFTPGAAMTIPLSLANDARSETAVSVHDVDGLEYVNVVADWRRMPAMFPYENSTAFFVEDPVGTQVFDLAPIEPSPGYGEVAIRIESGVTAEDGYCDVQRYLRTGPVLEQLQHTPRRLAGVRATANDSWVVATDGELGDAVARAWRFGVGADETSWVLWDDAKHLPSPASFPELPADIAWPSAATSELSSVTHYDRLDRVGYAAVLADPTSQIGPFNVDRRVWRRCEP